MSEFPPTKIAPIALAIIMLGLGFGLTISDFLKVIKNFKDFIVGFIFQSFNWIIPSYIAYGFGALSLYTGFFSTNDPNPPQPGEFTPEDFDNPADYADNIYRVLKSIKKDLLDIKKKNKGKLNKKDIILAIHKILIKNTNKRKQKYLLGNGDAAAKSLKIMNKILI